jgi:dihydrofolate reductase
MEDSMGKVILGMAMSLDGLINDRDGSVGRLYPDMEAMRESEIAMGRHSYDMAQGDYTGYEFQVPLFILTHDIPETVAKGANDKLSFNFVTDGVESLIEKAKAAAGDRNVMIVGGANLEQQCLKAGLVDEIHIDVRPIILGEGLRLFEHLSPDPIELETISIVNAGGVAELRYRVIK